LLDSIPLFSDGQNVSRGIDMTWQEEDYD